MVNRGSWLVSIATVLLLSCAKPPAGTFTADRFVHPEYPYRGPLPVRRAAERARAEWRLDNYVWTDGVPTKQKEGNLVTRSYDIDDDGEQDTTDRGYEYDLLLEHRNKDATIWFRNAVISNHDRAKDLAVFADNYVEAASGTFGVEISFGAGAVEHDKRWPPASSAAQRAASPDPGLSHRLRGGERGSAAAHPDARRIRQRVVFRRGRRSSTPSSIASERTNCRWCWPLV